MNIKLDLAKILEPVIASLSEGAMTVEQVEQSIEIPKNQDMGDYAFPCFKLAKAFKKAPKLIAEELADAIKSNDKSGSIIECSVPQNGFLNFKLMPQVFSNHLFAQLQNMGEKYGNTDIGKGKSVVVEFSSANIAKPFHIGHLRSTMIGNSLYRIYSALGYDATAVNHLGDYGTQFGKLISAFKRWGDKASIEANPISEFLALYVRFHKEAEEHPELDDEARAYFLRLEQGDPEVKQLWQWIRDLSLREFMKVYDMLGVKFDSYKGEAFFSDKMDEVLSILRDKGIVQKSEGAEIVDLSEYKMPNALITKSDGSTLYITRDLAAAIYRIREYEFTKNIYVVAYEQDLHFRQWFKILELMGFDSAKDCIHVNFGMVGLEDGALSTRQGRVVTLESVLKKAKQMALDIIKEKNPSIEDKEKLAEQVGYGSIVFQDLFNQRIKDYTFSWEKALSFEGESAPYVQYAHARANTLIEKSGYIADYSKINSAMLNDAPAQNLIKTLLAFPETLISAMEHNEPSKITRYAVELASKFNRFYHDDQINVEDADLKIARLALCAATKQVIARALYLIGVEAPEKM